MMELGHYLFLLLRTHGGQAAFNWITYDSMQLSLWLCLFMLHNSSYRIFRQLCPTRPGFVLVLRDLLAWTLCMILAVNHTIVILTICLHTKKEWHTASVCTASSKLWVHIYDKFSNAVDSVVMVICCSVLSCHVGEHSWIDFAATDSCGFTGFLQTPDSTGLGPGQPEKNHMVSLCR